MKGNRQIYYWLITGCILVATMVVIGGITRLTQSGLSMVEWKPIMGTLPPMNESEWLDAFSKYQESPEFEAFNYHFSLDDFKSIFWWEYIHRLLGRVIGLVFLIPFVIFWVKKKLSPSLKKKLIVIFILGGLQGLLGWFMVKSGLVDMPHVSHYRLAAHLLTALILLCYIYWVALWVRSGEPELKKSKSGFAFLTIVFLLIVVLQITYGAFVAGLKAGLQYNTWPLMGDSFVPETIGLSMSNYGLIGIFDSPPVVQFIHRIIAIIIVGFIIYLWIRQMKKDELGPKSKKAFVFLTVAVGTQFLLGIFTLIYMVPVSLGVIHQCGAILTLLCIFYLLYVFKEEASLIKEV